MTSPHSIALAEIVDGVEFDAGGNPLWFGTRLDPSSSSDGRIKSSDAVALLTGHLYLHAYAFGRVVKHPLVPRFVPRHDADRFTSFVRERNRGRGRVVTARVLSPLGADAMVVDWRGIKVRVPKARLNFVASSDLAEFNIGAEQRNAQRNAYVVLSDREPHAADPELRLYWNLRDRWIPELVSSLTDGLNRAEVAFSLKLMLPRFNTPRCDTAILYLPVPDLSAARPVIAATHEDLVGAGLGSGVPLWTRKLASGLGVAASPVTGQSFGELRSHQVAAAIVAAADAQPGSEPDVRSVCGHLASSGWLLDKPYLLSQSGPHLDDELWI